jgi:hypothetical protein
VPKTCTDPLKAIGNECKCPEKEYLDGEECKNCATAFPKSKTCNSDGPLDCDNDYIVRDGACKCPTDAGLYEDGEECKKCKADYFNSMTCEKDKILTCEEDHYVEDKWFSFPVCVECAKKFPHSLICNSEEPQSCKNNL